MNSSGCSSLLRFEKSSCLSIRIHDIIQYSSLSPEKSYCTVSFDSYLFHPLLCSFLCIIQNSVCMSLIASVYTSILHIL